MNIFKKTLILTLVLSLILAAAGCSAPAQASGSTPTTAATAVTGVATDPEQPDRTVDVYGKVKTIQGNVMVVDVMTNTQSTTTETLTAEEKAAKQAAMQALSEEERAKVKAASQSLTGVSVTVLIPVGVPVKTKASQLNGGLISSAAMTDITPGAIVSIWTEDSIKTGKVNAEYVRISAA